MLFFFCFHYSFIHDVICASHTSHAHLTHISCTSHHILYASIRFLYTSHAIWMLFCKQDKKMHSLISLDIFAIQKSYSRCFCAFLFPVLILSCALSKQKTAKQHHTRELARVLQVIKLSLRLRSIECKMGM